MTNFLKLVMIVKNASSVISKTLDAIIPFIDSYTILDTGSTDDTISIMRRSLENVQGNIFQESFIDFSTSRNRAIELAGYDCKYLIMLDDSFILQNGSKLLEALNTNHDMYYITINTMNHWYSSNRIFKSSKNYRYVYKIHEMIIPKTSDSSHFIPTEFCHLEDPKDASSKLRTSERLMSDLKLLDEETDTSHSNFYKGKTLLVLQRDNEAEKCFKKVIDLNKGYIYMAYEFLTDIYIRRGESFNTLCDMYMKMYKIDPTRAEPLYFLGLHFYNLGQYKQAIPYFQKAFELKIPLCVEGVNLCIYEFNIPYILADTYLHLGFTDYALKVLRNIKHTSEGKKMIETIQNLKSKDVYKKYKKDNRRIMVIHTTDLWILHKHIVWDPANVHVKCSGSEIMAINVANEFTKRGWGVFVFGSFKDDQVDYQQIISNVTYLDISKFDSFVNEHYIDVLIISRKSDNMVYAENIASVFLWLHDVFPVGEVFQTHPKKFKGALCMTNWHCNEFITHFNFPRHLVYNIGNSIQQTRFNGKEKKIPYRFIYSSDPARGLYNLLKLFPRIVEKFPLATLEIFARSSDLTFFLEIDKYPFVNVHDRVNQIELAKEIEKSDVWLYPTDFKETYCITAVEMQMGKVLCVTSKLAGLIDTVADRGVLVEGNPIEKKYQDTILSKLFLVLENPNIKNFLIDKAYTWAKQQTIENIANKLQDLL